MPPQNLQASDSTAGVIARGASVAIVLLTALAIGYVAEMRAHALGVPPDAETLDAAPIFASEAHRRHVGRDGSAPLGSSAAAVSDAPTTGPVLLLPLIGSDPGCGAVIGISNTGTDVGRAIFVAFPPGTTDCQGPSMVECSGILRPGATWIFRGHGEGAGVLLSVSDVLREPDAGNPAASVDYVADAICDQLQLADCAGYTALRSALSTGGTWHGIDLAEAAGPTMAAHVSVYCPDRTTPGVLASTNYRAPAATTDPQTLLIPAAARPESVTVVYLQNGSTLEASVDVYADADADCAATTHCGTLTLQPGAMYSLTALECGAGVGRPMRIEGGPGIAVVSVERLLDRDTAEAALSRGAAAPTLAGPYWGHPANAHQTHVQVVNTSPDQETLVVAEFHDRSGRLAMTRGLVLCPSASGSLIAPISAGLAGNAVGSITLTSQLPDGSGRGPPITGWVRTDLGSNPDRGGAWSYAMAAPLQSATPPAISLPFVAKDLNGSGIGSELSIANLESSDGWTDAAVVLRDLNGPVRALCLRLGPKQTAYLDWQEMGAIYPGFQGSAFVYPIRWNHAAQRPTFGLSALAVTRFGTRLGEDIPGDETGAALGSAIADVPEDIRNMAEATCDGAAPTDQPPIVATLSGVSFLPVLRNQDRFDVCSASITLRNPAAEPIQGVVVLFGTRTDAAECSAPLDVVCTGLLAPGGDWTIDAASLPEGAFSAAVLSVKDATVESLGGQPGDQRAVGTALCDALRAAADCSDWRSALLAASSSLTYKGIPVKAALATTLEVDVSRECPEPSVPGVSEISSYAAPTELGVTGASGGWVQSVRDATTGDFGKSTILYVQNAGTAPTAAELSVFYSGNCLHRTYGRLDRIDPGETVALAVNNVVQFLTGGVEIRSLEPLAVIAEKIDPSDASSPAFTYGTISQREPFDLDGDGLVSVADVALVEAKLGTTDASPGWNPALDVRVDGVINVVDVETVRSATCGTDQPADTLTATPVEQDTAAFMPVLLETVGTESCTPHVVAQNLGGPAKLVLVLAGEAGAACAAPLATTCSGLLRPGHTWHFDSSSWPSMVRSASVYRFDARPLSELGVIRPGDPTAADALCEIMFATLVGDCQEYAEFVEAWRTRGQWQGIPLGGALSGTVAADVRRDCAEGTAQSAYEAVSEAELGQPEPASEDYLTHIPLLYSDYVDLDGVVAVQNPGSEAVDVRLRLWRAGVCEMSIECDSVTILPGAQRILSPCLGPSEQLTGVLVSSGPVAVVVDNAWSSSRRGLFTYRGIPNRLAAPDDLVEGTTYGSEAYSPVMFPPDAGWDHGIVAYNMEPNRSAHFQAEFRDSQGGLRAAQLDAACPTSAQQFFSPVFDSDPRTEFGSVHVRSLRHGDVSARLGGVSLGVLYSDAARSTSIGMVGQNLLTTGESVSQYGARAPGAARLAVAGVDLTAGSNQLILTNLLADAGRTEVAVGIVGGHDLAATRCIALGPRQTATLALDDIGLSPDFRGAAFISAVRWTHGAGGAPGQPVVALAASLLRGAASAGDSSDPFSLSGARPVAELPDGGPLNDLACDVFPTATPSATSNLTATPTTPSQTPPTASTTVTPEGASPTPGGASATPGGASATPGDASATPGVGQSPTEQPGWSIYAPWVSRP